MRYLTSADIDDASKILRSRCGSMGSADAAFVQSPNLRVRVRTTADAFEIALIRNGGPFANATEACGATRRVLETTGSPFMRFLRAAFSVLTVLYPQSVLFVTIFNVLYDLWAAQNNTGTGIASPG